MIDPKRLPADYAKASYRSGGGQAIVNGITNKITGRIIRKDTE